MSILETPRGTKPQEESYKLRLELKEWEKSFAAAHSGRKAGRDDIKQHPDIGNTVLTRVSSIDYRLLTEHQHRSINSITSSAPSLAIQCGLPNLQSATRRRHNLSLLGSPAPSDRESLNPYIPLPLTNTTLHAPSIEHPFIIASALVPPLRKMAACSGSSTYYPQLPVASRLGRNGTPLALSTSIPLQRPPRAHLLARTGQ